MLKIFCKSIRGFKLPKNTKVEIERKLKETVKLRLNNPFFNVSIDLISQRWAAGLPSIVRNSVLQDHTKIQDDFATCIFTVKFEGVFSSPDVFDPLFEEHYQFVRKIYDLIESNYGRVYKRIFAITLVNQQIKARAAMPPSI